MPSPADAPDPAELPETVLPHAPTPPLLQSPNGRSPPVQVGALAEGPRTLSSGSRPPLPPLQPSSFAGRVPPRTPTVAMLDPPQGGEPYRTTPWKSVEVQSAAWDLTTARQVSCLWAAFEPLLRCCLRADDSPEERRRKSLVVPACSMVAAVSVIFTVLYGLALGSSGALRIAASSSFVVGCAATVAYAVATRTLPVLVVEVCGLWCLGTAIVCDIATVGMYEWWMAGMFIGNGLYLSEVRDRTVLLTAAIGALWIVLKTAEDADGTLGIMEGVPHERQRQKYGWETGVGVLAVRLTAHTVMFAVTRTFAESMRRERRNAYNAVRVAQESVRTAEKVAAALVRFDLNTAQQALVWKGWKVEGGLHHADDLRGAFEDLIANLKVYRPYLPAALFAGNADSAGSEGRSDHTTVVGTAWHSSNPEPPSPWLGTPAPIGDDSAPCSPRRGTGLHSKLCSLMVATLSVGSEAPASDDSLSRLSDFIDAVLGAAERTGGVVCSIDGQGRRVRVVVSWNAHRPQASHAHQACVSAVAAAQQLRERKCRRWAVSVSAGRALVGIVGSAAHRAPVLIGDVLESAESLAVLSAQIDCPVLADERVYDQARSVVTGRVVDAVAPRVGGERLVFELLSLADEKGNAELEVWVAGFGALRQKRWAEARAALGTYMASYKPHDRQARRLMKLAVMFDGPRDMLLASQQYIRHQQSLWQAFETLEFAGEARPSPVPGDPGCGSGSSSPAGSASSSPETEQLDQMPVDARLGPKHDPEVLRRMIEAAHLDSVRSGNTAGLTARGHVVPTHVRDSRGRDWHRSTKRLGSGAFGEVWLGMGADGAFAAIKTICLPDTGPGTRVFTEQEAHDLGGDMSAPTSLRSCTIHLSETPVGPGKAFPESPVLPGKMPTIARRHVDTLLAEVGLLSTLQHENIVEYLGSAVDAGYLLIVMEYVPGGSLSLILRQFESALPKAPVRRYFRDIAHGLQFLHDRTMVHRDLKPANILVTIEGQCKLCDFGASVELAAAGRPDEPGIPAGTAVYMAPEQARGEAEPASDVWAAGVVLCEMAGGSYPFPAFVGKHPLSIIFALGSESFDDPVFSQSMPPDAKDLCTKCLQRVPAVRPTAEQLLNHLYLLK